MPCPCRSPAMPCRYGFRMYLSHLIYTVRSCDSYLPCRAHAMLRPCRSSQGHGTTRPSSDGLLAACPLSASSGYHAEFHEGCYQTHINLRCRWPVWNQTPFVMDEEKSGSSTLQKNTIGYTVGLAVRIFPATMRTFTKDTELSEQGRGAAWHVWINGTARHGRGKACYVWIGLNSTPVCALMVCCRVKFTLRDDDIAKFT